MVIGVALAIIAPQLHGSRAAPKTTNPAVVQVHRTSTPNDWSRTRRFMVTAALTVLAIWIINGGPGERSVGERSVGERPRRTSLHELPPMPTSRPHRPRLGPAPPLR
jgi:hypothetical protein